MKAVASQLANKRDVSDKVFVWLDPMQMEIMEDQNPRQIIYGPASTGKTILIQLKVFQLIEENVDDNVLIILPNDRLVEKYKSFFKNVGMKSCLDGKSMEY